MRSQIEKTGDGKHKELRCQDNEARRTGGVTEEDTRKRTTRRERRNTPRTTMTQSV